MRREENTAVQGKKLRIDVFPERVGDIFEVLVLGLGRGFVFDLDAFVNFFAVHGNAFRGLNAKLDMTAIEVDHFNDDVVADPY